ncbi:hypothetical protein NC653_004490 [Populus alba x Populus x berolinensis]|uniref:Uncharacterized protein n=1 Tax=Populus alba x Populus x berolinensis TaxID=444605 RepID=A0AAD6RU51_9ROSI|nr:hypothetical protein NC653_004490 [Populus alba x Populus x berolinensis]
MRSTGSNLSQRRSKKVRGRDTSTAESGDSDGGVTRHASSTFIWLRSRERLLFVRKNASMVPRCGKSSTAEATYLERGNDRGKSKWYRQSGHLWRCQMLSCIIVVVEIII